MSESGIRKRTKDKKKKKGGVAETMPIQHEVLPVKIIADENMHVQKDAYFGGNLCTKLVFFIVLSVLTFAVFVTVIRYGKNDYSSTWITDFFNPGELNSKNGDAKFAIDDVEDLETSGSDTDVVADDENIIYQYSKYIFNFEKNAIEDETSSSWSDIFWSYFNVNEQNQVNNNEEDEDLKKEDIDNAETNTDGNDDTDDSDSDDDSKEEEEEQQFGDVDELPTFDEEYEYSKNERYGLEDLENDDDYLDENDNEGNEENNELEYEKMPKSDEDDDTSTEDYRNVEEPEFIDEPQENAEENEIPQQPSNIVTKLGVGAALIVVAYSVLIRKWNNYVRGNAEDAASVPEVHNELASQDNLENIQEQSDDSPQESSDDNEINEKIEATFSYSKPTSSNDTLVAYLETSSNSEDEDIIKESMRWTTSGADILAQEIEEKSNSDVSNTDTGSEDELEPSSEDDQDYDRANITNTYDWQLRDELDDADNDLNNGRVTVALEKFRKIGERHKGSVRAAFGMAECLDKKSSIQRSNSLLAKAIEAYEKALKMTDIPEVLFEILADKLIDRIRFRGTYGRSIPIHKALIQRFPENVSYQNQLAVTYLFLNRRSEAKSVLENILLKWPNNGFASVLYGFVLKMDGNLTSAVDYLSRGIESNEDGTQDAKFYFHLGDALQRLKKNDEAMLVYEKGVQKNIFLSKYQRSIYNVDRLAGKPWWTLAETTYEGFFRSLEENWKIIRDEILVVMKEKKALFEEESESLREIGDWRQVEIFARGKRLPQCNEVPITCRTVSKFAPAAGCKRGQIKFSLIEPGTHVWPHCGPSNCRLRAHLGLVIPANVTIRVAEETRNWKEGEVIVFDDSFEHEVWHNGTTSRLVLIVDVWHPELTSQERRTLTPI